MRRVRCGRQPGCAPSGGQSTYRPYLQDGLEDRVRGGCSGLQPFPVKVFLALSKVEILFEKLERLSHSSRPHSTSTGNSFLPIYLPLSLLPICNDFAVVTFPERFPVPDRGGRRESLNLFFFFFLGRKRARVVHYQLEVVLGHLLTLGS